MSRFPAWEAAFSYGGSGPGLGGDSVSGRRS